MNRLTEKDLAQRWGKSPRTLQGWRASGDGPKFVRLGKRSIYYLEEDVIAYERANVVGQPIPEPTGWRNAMVRAGSALDLLAAKASKPEAKETLFGLSKEIRTLLA